MLKKKKPCMNKAFGGYVNVVCGALFPLNGSGWFAADIVNHSVDAANFVDDAVGNAAE